MNRKQTLLSIATIALALVSYGAFGVALADARPGGPRGAGASCLGDCDLDGTVDFNDLIAILFEFGAPPTPTCDADGSGTVDFNDLIATLFRFGPCPPLVRVIDFTDDIGEIQFSRGMQTRDRNGTILGIDEPRTGRPKLRIGDLDIQPLTPPLVGTDLPLACGMSADGTQNILLRRVATTGASAIAYLDVLVGDERVLIDSGAPALAGGYGHKQVGDNHWFRYEGRLVGDNRGSPIHFNFQNIDDVWDFGDVIPQFRVGAGPNDPNALIATPYFGSVAWGLLGIQLRADRYISDVTPNGRYSTDGLIIAFWQFPENVNDPAQHWTIARGESDFTNLGDPHATGVVAYDSDPGRPRLAEWSRHNPSTPGRRSSERPAVLAFSSEDYLEGSNVGGDIAPSSALTVSQLIPWDEPSQRWDLDAIRKIQFDEDFPENPGQRHGHSAILISVVDDTDGGVQKLALCSLSADQPEYQGIYARVLEEAWDPDAPSAALLQKFEDPSQWSEKIWLTGIDTQIQPTVAAAQRLFSPRQSPALHTFLVGSDDKAAAIQSISWPLRSSPPVVSSVFSSGKSIRQYTFDIVQSRPTDPLTRTLMTIYYPDFLDGPVVDGRAIVLSEDSEAFGLWHVPHDGSVRVGRVWSFGQGNRLLYGGNTGIYTNDWPVTKRVTPLLTARGIRDVLAPLESDTISTSTGSPEIHHPMTRGVGGGFVDQDIAPGFELVQDPGDAPLGVRLDMALGNESVFINPFGGTAARSDGGGLSNSQSQRTFTLGLMLVSDLWPARPITPIILDAQIRHGGADGGNQYPPNGVLQLAGIDINDLSLQETERWSVVSRAFPHGWNGTGPESTGLRFRISSNGNVTRSRFYATVINAYEGRGWPGYQVAPGVNATALPESVTLGWPVDPDSVVFGGCFLSETVDPSLFPMYVRAEDADPADLGVSAPSPTDTSGEPWTLNHAEGEFVLCELTSPTDDSFLSLSVVFETVRTDSTPRAPLIRIRGRIGNTLEVIRDTVWVDADGRFPVLLAEHQITWALHAGAGGPWATCSSMGTRVSTAPVPELAGLPALRLEQLGTAITNQAHALELEHDFISVMPESVYIDDRTQFETFSVLDLAP